MRRQLLAQVERFPIAGVFAISRETRTEAQVVTCTLRQNRSEGRGECVPYARYGETVDSVLAQIEAARAAIETGIDRIELLDHMPAGAARNALDCALWDLEAKTSGRAVCARLSDDPPRPLVTAYTISLGNIETMAAKARAHAHRPLLKIKLGGEDDVGRIHAVADAAPKSRLILDANEGWRDDNIVENLRAAAACRAALVEQPLPAGADDMLGDIDRPVPVCADESLHVADDLDQIAGRYDCVNIKLDKTGGLTAALHLRDQAQKRGLGIMIGCMVATSLSMAPAVLLAQGADYVDLDGPLLLARDRPEGLSYTDVQVHPPAPALWG